MKITIAERLHPFSHQTGAKFLLPGTSWSVQVFPTRLDFSDLEGKSDPFFLSFDFTGPIREFTAELDLEHGHLRVFGRTGHGYMCYQIYTKSDALWLTMEKLPGEGVICRRSSPAESISLSKGESMIVCLLPKDQEKIASAERLSLGMHKAQDWDLICRRLDCKEIFPHWFLLGSLSPEKNNTFEETEGNFPLLHACKRKIEQGEKESVLQAFENLFLAAFEGVLVPRLIDSEHQGILPKSENTPLCISPMPLLIEGGKCIRSLFIQEREGELSLLPCLPPQFHCGRMIRARTCSNEVLDFEWTKKFLRSVLIRSESDKQICLKLPKGIGSFRLNGGKGTVKKIEVDSEGKAVLLLEGDRTAQLDRFEA
jgi:hypothetical protein